MRELLGKALQEKRRALSGNWERPWEEITKESQENARACAEAVISKYVEILTPGLLMHIQWADGRVRTQEDIHTILGINEQ